MREPWGGMPYHIAGATMVAALEQGIRIQQTTNRHQHCSDTGSNTGSSTRGTAQQSPTRCSDKWAACHLVYCHDVPLGGRLEQSDKALLRVYMKTFSVSAGCPIPHISAIQSIHKRQQHAVPRIDACLLCFKKNWQTCMPQHMCQGLYNYEPN